MPSHNARSLAADFHHSGIAPWQYFASQKGGRKGMLLRLEEEVAPSSGMAKRLRGVLSVIFAVFLLTLLSFFGIARAEPSNVTLASSAKMSPVDCRLLLLKNNDRQLLGNESITLAAEVGGSWTEYSENFTSDATGIVDLSKFYHKQISSLAGRYRESIKWTIRTGWAATVVDFRDCNGERLIPVVLQVDDIAVTGHFENRAGERITKLKDMFPSPTHEFLDANEGIWDTQIQLYQNNGRFLLNSLQADQEGSFSIELPELGAYRFSLSSSAGFRLVNPAVTVDSPGQHIVLVLEPRPYCLYGVFLDAYDGMPTTEWIDIDGLNAHYNNLSKSSRYALFFDSLDL